MRPLRTVRLVFAMLLLAMLPLRGFAADTHCRSDVRAVHAGHSTHCHETVRLHGCGDCCVAAIAIAATVPLILSRPPMERVSAGPARHPPTLDPDRLDRPPRLTV